MAPFEELRFQSVEGLAAAQIAGSRAGEAVKMLEGLVREYPTRENLWLELARGLHRLGRRDAALTAIQRAREQLREHLGLDPSALLVAFEQDLLNDEAPLPDNGIDELDGRSEPAPIIGYLPEPLSSFVGRTDEVREIAHLVSRSRLVTLQGLGGIGKTSLAVQVAGKCAGEFVDGAWFVDLAYVATAATMPERFLAAIGQGTRAEVAPLDQLLAYLRPLRALLVVDNCEQQIGQIADLVKQIVYAAPNVHILATSRCSLAISGEAAWRVDGLDVSSGVELFVDRARLVRHDFALRYTELPAIAAICEKLDGIPLAIELAAARLNVLGVDQILAHLDDRFELLQSHAAAPHMAERTLRSALDWSYELLDEHDQTLLRRLSVFPAKFTLDAATTICGDDNNTVRMVKSMALIVQASLVVFDDVDQRYRLLETVREYTAEKLSASEHDELARRHVTHYLNVAADVARRHETDHIGALRAGDQDLDNFRTAMANAFANGDHERGLAVSRHLRMYFFSREFNREYLRWLQHGIEHVDPACDDALFATANALIAAANSHQVDAAERLAERVARSIDSAQSPVLRSRLMSSLGVHLTDIDPRRADELLAAATDLVRAVDPIETVSCIFNRAQVAWRTGHLPDAAAMSADLDALPQRGLTRAWRALLTIQALACAGKWLEVLDATSEETALSEQLADNMRHFRAEALGALGRVDEAIDVLNELDKRDPFDDLPRSNSRILRATTELRRDGAATAKTLLAESAGSCTRESDRVHGSWLASLAGVATHQLGQDDTAARLFGYAKAIGDEFDIKPRASERPLIEHATHQCQARLGLDRFNERAARGASSSWSSLVELLHAD